MNCSLFYHLQQQAYLANIKSEFAEENRYKMEMLAHTQDCPFCNGHIPDDGLAENLFGGLVIVTAEVANARPDIVR